MSKTCTHICSFEGCEKTFSRKDRLIIHLRTHTGEKPYICECGKSYARSAHLTRHKETAHGTAVTETFLCEEENCNQTFSSKQSLHRHIKRKHEKKMYQCTYGDCGRSFHKHQQLSIHEYEHTQVKPFMCPMKDCDKRFLLPSKLKQHMKVHAGYGCDHKGCTEVFDNWTKLRQHKHTHHLAAHICTECDKSFTQKSWLHQHMKSHKEEREVFTCPRLKCGRTYLEQKNLTAHIRSFHDGQRFHCEFDGCDRNFTTKQKCQKHLLSHQISQPSPKKKRKKTINHQKKTIAESLTGINPNAVDSISMQEDIICLSDMENWKEASHVTIGNGDYQVLEFQSEASHMTRDDRDFKILKLQKEACHLTQMTDSGKLNIEKRSEQETDRSYHSSPVTKDGTCKSCNNNQYSSLEMQSCSFDSGVQETSPLKNSCEMSLDQPFGNDNNSLEHSVGNSDNSLINSIGSSGFSLNNSLCNVDESLDHLRGGNDISLDNSNKNGDISFEFTDTIHMPRIEVDKESKNLSMSKASDTKIINELESEIESSANTNSKDRDKSLQNVIDEPFDIGKVPGILQCTSKLWNTELF